MSDEYVKMLTMVLFNIQKLRIWKNYHTQIYLPTIKNYSVWNEKYVDWEKQFGHCRRKGKNEIHIEKKYSTWKDNHKAVKPNRHGEWMASSLPWKAATNSIDWRQKAGGGADSTKPCSVYQEVMSEHVH